ncbi:hypothetical protein PR202_gb09165 [Eleusine coracana subsp. coracana]|uniref:Uncharacterized protein n=1 Tax=Eleusine coracana subsp. coracana TaxID=191504 RepID=A0AAV5EG88_ELECO|nr:hypothetical protein PR202_gb09165 [Eleusine coracana subsp. coracana]
MSAPPPSGGDGALINEMLTDDELRAVLTRLGPEAERDAFGLVCRRWLRIQSSERRRLRARAGPDMLRRLAARFPGILELDLSQSPSRSFYPGVIDNDLDVIAGSFRNLRVLALQNCKVATVHASYRGLLSLKLMDCSKVGDKSIYALAKFCRNLECLVIGGCRNISDSSIEALAHACSSSLKWLRMDWCLKITDASLRSLLWNCKLLVAIDVGCCDQITDASFLDSDRNVFQSELRILKMSSCLRVTVAGVRSMIESCKSLEYLDLRSCPLVTKDSCEQAGLQFPSGCKVNFDGSLLDTDPSAEFF